MIVGRGIRFLSSAPSTTFSKRRRISPGYNPPVFHVVVVMIVATFLSSTKNNYFQSYGFSIIPWSATTVRRQQLQGLFSSDSVTGIVNRREAVLTSVSSLRMAPSSSDFDDATNDPFRILGLEEPTSDVKVIKRAYKRRALQYHPDVVVTNTKEEKKAASDRFAKINWAYETLSGKRATTDQTYGSASTGSAAAGGGGWAPPHRRSGGSYGRKDTGETAGSSSSSSTWPGTTDWRDFMPKYEEDQEYDAGGDSFGKIFSDLFAGAAVGAAGVAGTSAGLLLDFIEFLEGNVDGYGSGTFSKGSDDYDADLQVLLRTGSLDDVANEMDDTNLVVQQLQAKATSIDDEILTTNAEARMTSRYMEQIELDEKVAELKARKVVVDGYLKKARKRLLSLQTRYKELISEGANDSYAGGGGRSTARTAAQAPSPSTSTPSSSTGDGSSRDFGGGDKDSWMNEGFGSSSGRGSRGGARRRASRRTSASSSASPGARGGDGGTGPSSSFGGASTSSSPPPPPPPPPRRESPYSSSSSSSSSSSFRTDSIRSSTSSPRTQQQPRPSSIAGSDAPPHRRTSSYESSAEENKRRMREIKVDEEFEKLKKELGL